MNFSLPPMLRTGEEVAGLLRRMIHSGELAEGTKLPPQRELAMQLGVSRAVVREGLASLEAVGYVTTQRGAHGGTSVAPLGSNPRVWEQWVRTALPDFDDLCEFRIAVESRAAHLAAEHRTDQHIAAMRSSVAAFHPGMDRREFRTQDTLFHSTLAEASGSTRLAEAIRSARGDFFVPTDHLNFLPSLAVTEHAHARILEAVERGDGASAAELMAAHIETSRDELHMILH